MLVSLPDHFWQINERGVIVTNSLWKAISFWLNHKVWSVLLDVVSLKYSFVSLPEDSKGRLLLRHGFVDTLLSKKRFARAVASLVRLHGGVLDEYCKNSQRSAWSRVAAARTLRAGLFLIGISHGRPFFRDDELQLSVSIGWRKSSCMQWLYGIQRQKLARQPQNGILSCWTIRKAAIAKALRLLKQSWIWPSVVTFINTAGAYPELLGAEENCSQKAIALSYEMSDLKEVPVCMCMSPSL